MPSTAGERVEREEKTDNTRWCIAQDTAFEIALATIPYPPNHAHVASSEAEERWLEAVASTVPGKTAAQVKLRYDMLVEDVKAIEDGRVATPPQWDDEQLSSSFSCRSGGDEEGKKRRRGGEVGEMDRRKGMPWTEQEHRVTIIAKIIYETFLRIAQDYYRLNENCENLQVHRGFDLTRKT